MGAALVSNNFLPIPSKFSFHSQYHKSCRMFSSSELVAASSDCCRLENTLCLCLPVLPVQAEPESWPKSLAEHFAL